MLFAPSSDVIQMVAKKLKATAIPEIFEVWRRTRIFLGFLAFHVVYLQDNGSNFHVASDSEMLWMPKKKHPWIKERYLFGCLNPFFATAYSEYVDNDFWAK